MSVLCKRWRVGRPILPGKTGLYELNQADLMKWMTSTACRFCANASSGREVEQSFTRPDLKGFAAKPQLKLSNFQRRLLFTSGKYPSMEACPDFAGEAELRAATDICKTLFNLWCMMWLAWFWTFLHFIEKRRMRRLFARTERKEQRRMREMDIVNKELAEKRKLQKLQQAQS